MTNGADLSPQLEASLALVREKREQQVVTYQAEPVFQFTPAQQAMIRDTYANGATQKEFEVLLEIAKLRKLNPLLRQIHFVKRWNKQLQRDVWSAQVSIDGLRAIAERTGKYDGQDEPDYGPVSSVQGGVEAPAWCKVKVYRKDWTRPAVGIAYWSEYAQTSRDGALNQFWRSMPHVMIAKVAEAIAMRKAFPEDMGGLYTDDEMGQADNDRPQLANPRAMHTQPGESADAPDKESTTYNDIMKTLTEAHKVAFDTACTREQVDHWRPIVGRRGEPSSLCKLMSDLIQGDLIGPGQRQALGKLWNSVDRKLTQLEEKLPTQSDGTEVFQPAKSEEACHG